MIEIKTVMVIEDFGEREPVLVLDPERPGQYLHVEINGKPMFHEIRPAAGAEIVIPFTYEDGDEMRDVYLLAAKRLLDLALSPTGGSEDDESLATA